MTEEQLKRMKPEKRLEGIEINIYESDSHYGDIHSDEWLASAVTKSDVLFLLSLAKKGLEGN